MQLEGHWDNDDLAVYGGDLWFSDIWGYTAPDMTEVAMIGTVEGVYFFDVTNPANLSIIDSFTINNVGSALANSSGWRDFKTYGHYAYAVSDRQSAGLVIFDLQYVPDSVNLIYQDNQFFNTAHNVWIDEMHGRMYLAGPNTQTLGVIVLDIDTDPTAPALLASIELLGGYVHDIHVIDHIAYASHGSNGMMIYDFTIPGAPIWIATIDEYAEEGYNHSSWRSADGEVLVFCDETKGTSVKRVDITDPVNIGPTDIKLFKSNLLTTATNSVAHNPFILGDLVYIAYYHDGVQVFNIADPDNIYRLAYYDTYPENTNYSNFLGCWGVYPYLPSGNIIASDIQHGLFVLSIGSLSLPLEFISFEAKNKHGKAILNWQVSELLEGDRFFVEGQSGMEGFKELGQVEGVEGRGLYNFEHTVQKAGTVFYRIRAQLKDGTEVFSPVTSVLFGKSADDPLIYPTVSNDFITVKGIDDYNALRLVDEAGRIIQHIEIGGQEELSVDVSSLPAGIYIVQLTGPFKKEMNRRIFVP